jgi:hypothetical protein
VFDFFFFRVLTGTTSMVYELLSKGDFGF